MKLKLTNANKAKMLEESQKVAAPGKMAILHQLSTGQWVTRHVDKPESMLKAEVSAAKSAAAHASRKAMNTTAVSKQAKALQDEIEKGEKPGASAKNKLKATLAKAKLAKL